MALTKTWVYLKAIPPASYGTAGSVRCLPKRWQNVFAKPFSDNQAITLLYNEQSECFVVNYLAEGMMDRFEEKDFEIDRGIKHLFQLGSHSGVGAKCQKYKI